jgi:hypothetical protein
MPPQPMSPILSESIGITRGGLQGAI